MFKLVLCLACYSLFGQNEAARILAVFPFPSISHQVAFRPLTQELARRGHEVVVVTPDPAFPKGQSPANLSEIDIHDASYKLWRENIVSKSTKSEQNMNVEMKELFEAANGIFDSQFQDKQVLNLLQNSDIKFDLLIIEACSRPALIFSHFFKVPVILMSSFGVMNYHFDIVGMPRHTMLYPTFARKRLNNLTMWEKISEYYHQYLVDQMIAENEKVENEFIRKRLGPTMPKLSELYKNIHMIFLNVHPIFENIRPVTPSVIYLGGVHQKPEKELPQDLKSYLDSSNNGVIYVSFGTNVDPATFPDDKIQIFVKVLSKLPYNVLWKWNRDELPGRTENIKISKWLPQSDLLRHQNVKLFITQGGLQSTDEAITAGVPLVGIPILGDQWFNVEKHVQHKIGVRVDIETMNEEKLTRAIKTVLEDESYRRNIVKLRELMYDQPQTPLERGVWWVEYVLRHGGARHLRSPSASISWWEYLELELVFTVLGIALIVLSLVVTALYSVYEFISRNFIASVKIKSS